MIEKESSKENINNNINNTPDVVNINTSSTENSTENNIPRNSSEPIYATKRISDYMAGLTAEQRAAQCVAAGKASQEARKRKKTFQEQARALLEIKASQESIRTVLGDQAEELFPEGEATTGQIMLARMLLEGWAGNTKAAEFTRDTAGYKPTQEISLEGADDAVSSLLDNVAKRLEKEANRGQE